MPGSDTLSSGYTVPGALPPYADESLPGLVMRNAERFHFQRPMRLFQRLAAPKVTLWTFCQQDPATRMGQDVRTLLGLGELALSRLTMWTGSETTLSILGHPVWRELVRHSARGSARSAYGRPPTTGPSGWSTPCRCARSMASGCRTGVRTRSAAGRCSGRAQASIAAGAGSAVTTCVMPGRKKRIRLRSAVSGHCRNCF